MNSFVSLTRDALGAQAIERLAADPAAGAVVSFIGVTRDNHFGRRVITLEYEAHETLALKMLEKLCAQALEQFGLIRAAVYHRLGKVEIGEASVVIAVSAAHRGAAFDGCRFLIDELKTTVPIWKKEYYADGSEPVWVGPDGKPVQIC
ncbi:MAG TPA: molybdenum cofactor biosynthesis protein MoaE [Planctomycetota bacterium]|nr:molybdenum cofactor biosynthesis protein MoaE [Planctomycetota bacterium]